MNKSFSFFKAILGIICAFVSASSVYAVPAYRGWRTMHQPDGTEIKIRQVGDEFYHYTLNEEGKEVRQNADGFFEVVGEAPAPEVAQARRAKAQMRRMKQEIGTTPNLAPKGVVILANFKDQQMKSEHTQAVFDELCNSENCTVNAYNGTDYPSAAQYFADQSNGEYRPVFDVFGPVTLSKNYAYYGEDMPGQDEGYDKYAADAVVEACLLANKQYDINFADYSTDGKYVDFVYVIYAGKGQADGGDVNTIWPHNWEISSCIYYKNCTYTREQAKVDGKYIENYACSAELSGSALGGIGTLCHEFGHVMGLPDWYDTSYGTNYDNYLTPNEWDIMDGGAYNGDGHCPPNYSPWEKYFFGWVDPINPGETPANDTLYANGTDDYNVYQINNSGVKQDATQSGWAYYLENRQMNGWDEYIPDIGMVIWKVNFDASSWQNNTPNNTSNAPKYTIVCSQGTEIGADIGANYGKNNVFPNGDINSWTDLSNRPVTEISKSGQLVTFLYMGGVVEETNITWMALPSMDTPATATKILQNGHIYILRNGETYTISGQIIQ